MSEIEEIFTVNNIDVSVDFIAKLFKCHDEDSSGTLNVHEFKKFTQNLKAKNMFKDFTYDKRFGPDQKTLPFDFGVCLEHLTNTEKRKKLIEQIDLKTKS